MDGCDALKLSPTFSKQAKTAYQKARIAISLAYLCSFSGGSIPSLPKNFSA
jgi:hypothetical protein